MFIINCSNLFILHSSSLPGHSLEFRPLGEIDNISTDEANLFHHFTIPLNFCQVPGMIARPSLSVSFCFLRIATVKIGNQTLNMVSLKKSESIFKREMLANFLPQKGNLVND